MSAVGLRNYIERARALSELGRGPELVVSYIQEMPLVVKEFGEEAIPDVVTGVMKLASMVEAVSSRPCSTVCPPPPMAWVRGDGLGMLTRFGQADEQTPPVVDQGSLTGHEAAALEIVGGEATPAPVVLQFVERVLGIAAIPIELRHGANFGVQ